MSSSLLKYFSYIIVLSLSFMAYAQESDLEFMYAFNTAQQDEEEDESLKERFIAKQPLNEEQQLFLKHFLSEFHDAIQITSVVIALEQQDIKNREFKKIAKKYIAEQPLQDESVGVEFLKLYSKNRSFRERFHKMQAILAFNDKPLVSQEEVSLPSEASLSGTEYLGLYAQNSSFKELVDEFQLFVLLQTGDKGLLEKTLDLTAVLEASSSLVFVTCLMFRRFCAYPQL